MMCRIVYLRLITLVLFISTTHSLWAAQWKDGKVQLHGFLSQAALHTTDNNFFGQSDDDISWEYRELGAVFFAQLYEDWNFSTQLLARKAGENADGKPKVDHAILSYTLMNSPNANSDFQLGRMKSQFGLLNETRDVPFTRQGVFLAQSVYSDRLRNSMFFQDGIRLRGNVFHGLNTFSWFASYHLPVVDDDEIDDITTITGVDKVDTEGAWNVSFLYEFDVGRWRIGMFLERRPFDLSFTDSAVIYDELLLSDGSVLQNVQFPSSLVGDTEITINRVALSLEYNTDKWKLIGERVLNFTDIDTEINANVFPDADKEIDLDSLAYYLEANYSINQKWSVFTRYDVFYDDKNNKKGKRPSLNFQNYPSHSWYFKDKTLGAGWYVTSDILLRIEWHSVKGGARLTRRDNPDLRLTSKSWDLFVAQFSYRFR